MRLYKALFRLFLNPRLLAKFFIGTFLVLITPRFLFLRRLRRNSNININGVLFNIDQKNPVTQRGLIESYSDYLTIEKAGKINLYEVDELDILYNVKRYLKPGDVFFDVGAHFGYFSAHAAACVSEKGEVHAFEPVPFCYEYLEKLVSLNPAHNINITNTAVGDTKGNLNLSLSTVPHLSSHTLVSGFLETKEINELQQLEVAVLRLDDYIEEKNLLPKLIKIDVEGFEFQVLRGLERFFETSSCRPIVICEINPVAYELLGHSTDDIYQYMKKYGYEVFYSWNSSIKIKNITKPHGHNVVFKQQ